MHSHATSVSVRACRRSDALHVEAADDGVGGAHPSRGIGLRDVAGRVGALGGRLTITSPPGGGTRLEATIPCA
ncbi:MAG: sensor histidine kinase [Pyrinomonadaceae bacterium]